MLTSALSLTLSLGVVGAATMTLPSCAHRLSVEQRAAAEQARAERVQSRQVEAQAAAEEFAATKERYLKRASASVAELTAEIDAFKASAPEERQIRETYPTIVASLEENLGKTQAWLDEAKQADSESWDFHQRQLEQSLLTTKAALDAATLAH